MSRSLQCLALVVLAGVVSGELVWTQVSVEGRKDAPVRRYDHESAVLGGKTLLVTHGYLYVGYQNWLDDTWLYHVDSNRWEKLDIEGAPPDARYSHSFNQIGEDYYLFGGDDGTVKTSPDNYIPNPHKDLWRLSSSNGKWRWTEIKEGSEGKAWPGGRAGHAAWVHNNKLYIFGGFQQRSDVWSYTPGQGWTELVEEHEITSHQFTGPGTRFSVRAAVIGDDAYIFGGYRRGANSFADFWKFRMADNTWVDLKSDGVREGHVPHNRGAYAMAAWKGKIVLFGGADCSPVCLCYDDTWIYDPATNLWEEIDVSRRPPPRYKHSLNALADGRLLLFGGEGYRFASDYHNDVWLLAPETFLSGWRLWAIVFVVIGLVALALAKLLKAKPKARYSTSGGMFRDHSA